MCMPVLCSFFIVLSLSFFKQFATPSHPINFISCLTSLKFEKLKAAAMVKYAYEDEASDHVSLFKGTEDETSQEVELLTDTTDTMDIQAPTDQSSLNAMMMERVLISKAKGISPHVLLLGIMQKVIASQHMFLQEMKKSINEDIDKRHMASDSFEAKNQLAKTLTSLEERLLRTFKLPLGGFDDCRESHL